MSIGARIRSLTARVASDFGKRLAGFRRSTRANVAMIFGISLVPITIAAGTGLDLARGMVVHAQLTTALDAAALAAGGTPGLTQPQMQSLAQQYFNANYKIDSSFGTPAPLNVVVSGQTVTVSTSNPMPTTLMNVCWHSFFHDQCVFNRGLGPGEALGFACARQHRLDDTNRQQWREQDQRAQDGDTFVADHAAKCRRPGQPRRHPGCDRSFCAQREDRNELRQRDLAGLVGLARGANARAVQNVGPGSTCPYTDGTNEFHCQTTPTNGSSSTNTIPNSGTYKGYICPSDNAVGHYYNGCWTSTGSSGNYTHTWTTNNKNTWGGCVTDRAQDYDTNNTTPVVGTPATLMVAENSPSCVSAALLPLGYNWTSLNSEVDSMVANGSTNQTIGLAWGWQALTQNVPLSAPALPANTQQVMILLSDGLNTQDRWYGDGSNQSSQVDSRMALACTHLKAANVTIYTVFVDLNGTQGNSAVLQTCATDLSKYFDLTNSNQIIATFQAIGQQITNLHVLR